MEIETAGFKELGFDSKEVRDFFVGSNSQELRLQRQELRLEEKATVVELFNDRILGIEKIVKEFNSKLDLILEKYCNDK